MLVSDINKGLLTPALLGDLIEGSRARKIPIVIDPRMTEDFSIYRGATAITPNRYESELATGIRLTDRDAWREAAESMVRKLDLQACLITLDRDGMYLAARHGAGVYLPTAPREVYDVTGAGDIVLTVFGLFAIAGLSFEAAAAMANLAAGIEVSRHGAEVISRDDLARALGQEQDRHGSKIVSIEELGPALDRERREGRRIVFTNGCFDLLHAGHVQLLSFARSHGDVLVVGLNSDRSVRALKGGSRPVYPAASGPGFSPRSKPSITSRSSTTRARSESCARSDPTCWSRAKTGAAKRSTAASSWNHTAEEWCWRRCSTAAARRSRSRA